MKLKILSWNIWIDNYFEEVKKFLVSSNADIIGLQEVKDDDPERDVIGFLKDLGYYHVFEPIKHSWKGIDKFDGPAIFSKYEIKNSSINILSDDHVRAAVRAEVDIDGMALNVFCTHLIHTHQKTTEAQKEQADNLVKILTEKKTILVGDFNSTPESAVIKKIEKVLKNTDSRNLPTWCLYPVGCTECNFDTVDTKLDYIFVSGDIKVNKFTVGDSKGSDHLPILAEIVI